MLKELKKKNIITIEYVERRKRLVSTSLIFVFLFLMTLGSKSMAFGKVHLSSAVNGVVLKDGGPVENVKVFRRLNWHWGNKQIEDSAATDTKGAFTLDVKNASSFTAIAAAHSVI
jgi:hypothetical protein